ncbi:MAG: D-alanine--D-alanine ligase [Azospirillum sp.]|jgi:D-alanine-D-alanine ligase|nr:D-alanine--D-alanine ligase [Azospirillum sp.]MCZ8122781.1 D-alanine--D-alanine ligase [Magnetospirillum sp.]
MKKVLLLKGGLSSEREVSLVSGRECAKALRAKGYDVTEHDLVSLEGLTQALAAKPDVVFNALHGRWAEDGTIQGALDLARVPYTHSGLLASALAMDKPVARDVFAGRKLPVAEGGVFKRADVLAGRAMPIPFVMKPSNEGSSVGVKIVLEQADLDALAKSPWPFGEEVLVEAYVPGRELTVAVMGFNGAARALGVLEIRPNNGFYDYEAKYTDGKAIHLCPAPVHKTAYDEAMRVALEAHRALGCRGVSRADLRYDDTRGEPGRIVLLEVNTQPGMTPLSLVPEIAAAAGIAFGDLCAWLVENAVHDGPKAGRPA